MCFLQVGDFRIHRIALIGETRQFRNPTEEGHHDEYQDDQSASVERFVFIYLDIPNEFHDEGERVQEKCQ